MKHGVNFLDGKDEAEECAGKLSPRETANIRTLPKDLEIVSPIKREHTCKICLKQAETCATDPDD
jgi:ribosomal protein L37AE/L43A